MSRHKLPVNDDQYLIVGWDNPLNSYFYQLWNWKDKILMKELEDSLYDKETKTDVIESLEGDLDLLYSKYPMTGGEPILSQFGADGIDYLHSIAELREKIKEAVGHDVDIPEYMITEMQEERNPLR